MSFCRSVIAIAILTCSLFILANGTTDDGTLGENNQVDNCPASNKNVAPDDTIVVSGPAPDSTQIQLGITWKYKWITKNSAGIIVDQTQAIEGEPGRIYRYTVPRTGYAEWYSIRLFVTAAQAETCINEACTRFTIMKPDDCTMQTNPAQTIICTEDETSYTYSTGSMPSQVRQRWWIFPEAEFPGANLVTWGGFGNYMVPNSDTNTITTSWHNKPTGKYIVFTGYYPKTGSDKLPVGSCQKLITVVAKPTNTITEAF